ncbi:MAG: TolC family protein [Bacteroidales bacterium]|nr:TolC family protein [Bacteroidales bacterium]
MKRAFILLVLVSQAVCAQPRMSLDNCIEYALEHNLQLKQQQIAVASEEDALVQSKLGLLPSVGLGADYSLSREQTRLGGSLTVNMTLFDGLLGQRRVESAYLSLAKARNASVIREMELKIAVTKAFLSCLLARRASRLADESYRSVLLQRDFIAKKVDAGDRPAGAMAEIDAEVAATYSLTVSKAGEALLAQIDLTQLLEWDGPLPFDIEEPEEEALEPPSADYTLIIGDAAFLPAVSDSEYELELARKQLQIAQSGLFPTLTASAGINTFYYPEISDSFGVQIKNNYLFSGVFTLSVPIFNHYSAATAVKNAKGAVRIRELQLKRDILEAQKELQLAVNQANVFYQNYLASARKRDAATEALRISTKKLESGLAAVSDWILSRDKYSEAQNEYTATYYQYLFQIKILGYYLEY